MIDYVELRNDVSTDAGGLGTAGPLASGSDIAIAALYNGAANWSVSRGVIDRDTFLSLILPALVALPGLSAAIQAKWDRVLSVICAATSVDTTNTSIQALLTSSVTDAVLTQPQATAALTRQGTRAEVLFGAGTVLSANDIAKAFGRGV